MEEKDGEITGLKQQMIADLRDCRASESVGGARRRDITNCLNVSIPPSHSNPLPNIHARSPPRPSAPGPLYTTANSASPQSRLIAAQLEDRSTGHGCTCSPTKPYSTSQLSRSLTLTRSATLLQRLSPCSTSTKTRPQPPPPTKIMSEDLERGLPREPWKHM